MAEEQGKTQEVVVSHEMQQAGAEEIRRHPFGEDLEFVALCVYIVMEAQRERDSGSDRDVPASASATNTAPGS